MLSICGRFKHAIPVGGAERLLLILLFVLAEIVLQYGAAQAQSDWSGWHHCDIQDHDYDGPGTRYFCRPVSFDWLCNTARITFFCRNPAARDDKGKRSENGESGAAASGRTRTESDLYLGMNIRQIGAAGVGVQWIIDAGAIDAVDVWGEEVQGEVCLDGLGRLLFLDASTSPRAQSWLESYQRAGQTCAVLDRAGTVVLMPGARRHEDCPVFTTGNLKVRAEPSLDADVIGYVRAGVTLRLISRRGAWIKIDYQGEAGWIGADYVREDCDETVSVAPAAGVGDSRICTTGDLRVRAGPSPDENVIGYVRRGSRLLPIARSGEWIEIEYQGEAGWIGAGYASDDCG